GWRARGPREGTGYGSGRSPYRGAGRRGYTGTRTASTHPGRCAGRASRHRRTCRTLSRSQPCALSVGEVVETCFSLRLSLPILARPTLADGGRYVKTAVVKKLSCCRAI